MKTVQQLYLHIYVLISFSNILQIQPIKYTRLHWTMTNTDLALQTVGEIFPTFSHIQIFEQNWKIWEFLSPPIPGHHLRIPSSADICITASAVLSASKPIGCRMNWDHPRTNHCCVHISSAFHHSDLISVIQFLFIHIASSHTYSHHTFKKVTKNVKCFYNPTKPHLLFQPPA